MDPTDPGQEQEKPPEQCCDSTASSRGRQRKKNPKYLDFETDDASNKAPSVQRKSPRWSSGERGGGRGGRGRGRGRGGAAANGAASQKSPAKGGIAENVTQQNADGEVEGNDNASKEYDGEISEETPKKAVRAKKTRAKRTPAKRTPAKKTPAKKTPIKKTPAKKTPAKSADGILPAEDGEVVETVQLENGTPKPKGGRKRASLEVEPHKEEPPIETAAAEEEMTPCGRRRRGAAKAALKYLRVLAKEVFHDHADEPGIQSKAKRNSSSPQPDAIKDKKSLKGNKGRKGLKRKRADYDSDAADDEDFVPSVEDVEEEEEDDEENEDGEDFDLDFVACGRNSGMFHVSKGYQGSYTRPANGLSIHSMKTIWETTEMTKKFREEYNSSWEFPEWIPSSSDWHLVPQRDMEKYLPQEKQSAAFKVSRHGLTKEESPLLRLDRFQAVPVHKDRWDTMLFTGGPVWAMEWCPTPGSAPASQYLALACHQGMDDRHYVNQTYTGSGLVQLWDTGNLVYNRRPDTQPSLAYCLAQDKGFIWQLKWCPAGGWEPPSCDREAPLMPRLGLLAIASSNSVVTIYSLPHPDALLSSKKGDNFAGQHLPIYKADAVLTLKLGSFKAPRLEKSGQVMSMDWLPEKPHNIIAIGFYDGIVGLWDLCSKAALLRVREPDKSLTLLPYRCLLAHDHAIRAVSFCPASRHLLATAGEDRLVKTWDLRRLYYPINVLKRFLTNEICWPMNAPGIMLAQDSAYSAIGSHGVHYFDHYMRSYFSVPRTGTLWSISYSDWLNCVVTSDSLGEVIFAVLPQISHNPQYMKRTLERRFPIYLTSLVPYDATNIEDEETGRAQVQEEEEEEEEEEEGGEETTGADPGSEAENESENGRVGRRGRKDGPPPMQFPTYKDAVKKYCLHIADNDMGTFVGSEKRAVWKRMKATEVKAKINMVEMPLAALHKVRFNPNMLCHTWLASGGQAGLVRLNCIRSMINSQSTKIIEKSEAQVDTGELSSEEPEEAVQTATDDL